MALLFEHECHITFARSGGPGGQNVNKTSTKVVVHWCVGTSRFFSDEQKMRIRTKLAHRMTKDDMLVIMADEERSQAQNKIAALARLNAMVEQALRVPKARRATKPTRGSQKRRLEHKRRHGSIKRARQERFE